VDQGGVLGIAGIVLPIDSIDQFTVQTQAAPESGRKSRRYGGFGAAFRRQRISRFGLLLRQKRSVRGGVPLFRNREGKPQPSVMQLGLKIIF